MLNEVAQLQPPVSLEAVEELVNHSVIVLAFCSGVCHDQQIDATTDFDASQWPPVLIDNGVNS